MAISDVRLVDLEGAPINSLQSGEPVAVYPANALSLMEFTITRPADTTQYAAGDVVADISGKAVYSFTNAPLSGFIVGVALIDTINAATLIQPELWCWDRNPGKQSADNVAFAPVDFGQVGWVDTFALNTSYVGGATAGSGGSTVYKSSNLNSPYGPATGLHFAVVTRNAYTPASGEQFTVRVWILPA